MNKIFIKNKINKIILLSIFCSNAINPSYNTQLLSEQTLQDVAQVQTILEEQGFQHICFTTQDHLKLYGMLLDQSKEKKIEGTILYCAGFYPGTKEGMSSFYALLYDQPYNFLIFDARGHQESQGSLLSYQSLKNYGCCEYQDIIAALQFLNEYNAQHHINPNIIIHGICSGAFHSIKAIDHLKSEQIHQIENIKGIIFDSGWLQVTDIAEPTICAEIKKRLRNSWLSWLVDPLCYLFLQCYRLTFKHHHAHVPDISNAINHVPCPIFFIHCINDPYVPVQPIQNLIKKYHYPYYWWIEHSSHANFHMHNPQKYTEKIINFIKTALN